MKTKIKFYFVSALLLIAVSGMFFVSCKDKNDNADSVISNEMLVGKWRYDETGEDSKGKYKGKLEYIFYEKGTGFWTLYFAYDDGTTESEVDGFKYYISRYDESTNEGNVVINFTKGGSTNKNFKIDGDKLIMRDEVYTKTR